MAEALRAPKTALSYSAPVPRIVCEDDGDTAPQLARTISVTDVSPFLGEESQVLDPRKLDEVRTKFDLSPTEVSGFIKRLHCVCHFKIIHHGNAYIFPNYLCFASVTWRNCRKIAWSDVESIELAHVGRILLTVRKTESQEKQTYIFSHFTSRQRAYQFLKRVWEHALGDQTVNLEQLRAPSCENNLSDVDGLTDITDTESDSEIIVSAEPETEPTQQTVSLPPVSTEIGQRPPQEDREPQIYQMVPLSLQAFWIKFMSTDTHWRSTHAALADRVSTMTDWIPEGSGLARQLQFEMDIRSTFFKGICTVVQTQRCWMSPTSTIILCTNSSFDGIPYAKDLTVRTYWEVSRVDSAALEPSPKEVVQVKIWFWVDWIKVPFTKSMVEKPSLNGARTFLEMWLDLAYKEANRPSSVRKAPLRKQPKTDVVSPVVPPPTPSTTISTVIPPTKEVIPATGLVMTRPNPPAPATSTSRQMLGTVEAWIAIVAVVLVAVLLYLYLSLLLENSTLSVRLETLEVRVACLEARKASTSLEAKIL